MFAAIVVLGGIAAGAGLAASWLLRRHRRRPQRQAGVPVMLSSWSGRHESTVAVHLRRGQR
ncbi:hypothetical protein RugamoR64_50690 [Duganella rhizosphaerae]|uniref:hypothetical protein n=1 Tax=Duganella rhizosphaerae TaxID=2885763 RepID=UPI0030E969AF